MGGLWNGMEWRFDRLMWKVFLGGASCVYGGGEEREREEKGGREREREVNRILLQGELSFGYGKRWVTWAGRWIHRAHAGPAVRGSATITGPLSN